MEVVSRRLQMAKAKHHGPGAEECEEERLEEVSLRHLLAQAPVVS